MSGGEKKSKNEKMANTHGYRLRRGERGLVVWKPPKIVRRIACGK